jgi:serine phosphatase RsbU (regulator of sigma subunit)
MRKDFLKFFIIILLCLISNSYANTSYITTLTFDSLRKNKTYSLIDNWLYHAGDNPLWKNSDYPDSSWETVDPRLLRENLPSTGWYGIGWFRLHIQIDSLLLSKPLGIIIAHAGASEIYLNGKKLCMFGKILENSNSEEGYWDLNPKSITLNKLKNVIAIRYFNHSYSYLHKFAYLAGFSFTLGDIDYMIGHRINNMRSQSVLQLVFMVFPIALAILHIFLFIFSPDAKQNLYYAIFLGFISIFIYFNYQWLFTDSLIHTVFFNRFAITSLIFSTIFGIMTIYSLFTKLPRHFYYLILLGIIISVWGFFVRSFYVWNIAYIFIVGVFTSGGWVLFSSHKKESGGEWIIRSGFIVLSVSGIYQILISTDLIEPLGGFHYVYFMGVVVFVISMSLSLARDYAFTSYNLKKKLMEVKELSAKTIEQERRVRDQEIEKRLLVEDNKRKSRELEDARQLQLSMLPQCIDNIPGLDVCFHMTTATEVGGDYYDYLLSNNDTLTIAVGDATGHGMKAGTMVSAIKSLFIADGACSELTDFLNKCSRTIHSMNLGNLYMALILLRINQNKVKIASAGMPPVYVHRKRTNDIEEIITKALPLGGVKDYQYSLSETSINPGDTLLIMSDGYPELFNENNETFDYHRVKQVFQESDKTNANMVVDQLINAGDNWRNGRAYIDDITFVVIRKND